MHTLTQSIMANVMPSVEDQIGEIVQS